jgi:hypothetical protein
MADVGLGVEELGLQVIQHEIYSLMRLFMVAEVVGCILHIRRHLVAVLGLGPRISLSTSCGLSSH